MKYCPESGCWDVGTGSQNQRTLALIINAMDAENPVTRWICREILAAKLNRLEKNEHE